MTLRFAEELLLLFLDEDAGDLTHIPESRLHFVLGGATLMDLAMENRVDTDLDALTLVDDTPLRDSLLDPVLADIAGDYDPKCRQSPAYWVRRAAKRGGEIRAEAVRRLVKAGILESPDYGYLFLASGVMRSRMYPSSESKVTEVRLRIMRVLFAEEVPDPKDIVIIALIHACGEFEQLLSREELEQVRPRIELLVKMDLIGREVARSIREESRNLEKPVPGPRAREIPAVRGLPVLGSALDLRKDLIAFLTKGYLQHGPVFKFKALNRHFTALTGPDANEFAARHGKVCFSTHWSWREFTEEQGARRDVISMDGAEHVRLRRALAWGFSGGLYQRETETALSITRSVLEEFESGKPVSAHRLLQRMVVEQIGTITTGFKARDYVDDLIEYLDIMLATRVAHQSPRFLHARRLRKLSARMDDLFREVFERRRSERRTAESRDLIDDILDLHRRDPQFLPESDFRMLFIAPFLAGIDTAAGTAVFMLYELLRNPDLLQRVRAEVDPVFDKGAPLGSDLRGFDVTHRIALETLRLYPLGSAMMRTAVNSFDFAGYRIDVGTQVLVGNTVTHFLPEFFPNPHKFDIERYAPERAEHRQQFKYAPFGLGEHRCLGRGFAESLIMLTIATIVRYADPVLANPDYKLKTISIPTLRPDSGFLVRLPPRRH